MSEENLDERYNHTPGGFHWQVERLDLGHAVLSRIARNVCVRYVVWPEQLFGRRHSGVAVFSDDIYPLATGPAEEPMTRSQFAFCRRLIWRAAYEATDLADETIAELTGFASATVRPWARDEEWRRFEKSQGVIWWWYWGPSIIDLVGCKIPEYLERLSHE